ncbi:PREDICTED: erythroid transcription factor [Cyprinodon variegatus]|uniref:GATA binding protein 1 n=1 Tax=Cyprinodon variegatus TaxID=28743 RepID=A0A3Q2CNE8_CYPVA|nr:PREDICTED: erythroid transcription factor [Cyprinodon variegatus]
MMSDLFPSAVWTPASPLSGCGRSSGFGLKFDPAPSAPLIQSQRPSDEANPKPLSLAHQAGGCHPFSSALFGHHAVAPPPDLLCPPPPGWNSFSRGLLSTSSSSSAGCCPPEQRECASCGTRSALLWRRVAAAEHLCYTCSLRADDGRKDRNTPLLRPRRRAMAAARRGTRCSNCETETTSLWRRNAAGEPVCNACGLYYKLHQVQRPLILKKEEIQTRKRKAANRTTARRRADQSGRRLPGLDPSTPPAHRCSTVQ